MAIDLNLSIPWIDIGIQAIGFVAMAVGILSYQAKKRNSILFLQIISSSIWAIQFILLGAYTGAFMNLIGVARNIIYSKKDKISAFNSSLVPIIISAFFIFGGVFTYSGFLSILPVVAMIISSFALYSTEERKIRLLSLFVSPPWLIYDAISGSIPGVINELFTICSILIAVFRFDIKRNKKSTD